MVILCVRRLNDGGLMGTVPISLRFKRLAKHNRLSFRLFAGVAVWLVCALIFTGYTVLLSWTLENGGVAINDAGSLRKRTYQMALLTHHDDAAAMAAQQSAFQSTLARLADVGLNRRFMPDNLGLQVQTAQIERRWRAEILPWLNRLQAQQAAVGAAELPIVDGFAHEINQLVTLIEQDNTRSVRLLRLFQMLLLCLAVVTGVSGIYLLRRLVTLPLARLHEGILQIGSGALRTQIDARSGDEFGLVAQGFNQMALRLHDAHTHLERRVADKTQALAGKNIELVNLYTITSALHRAHSLGQMTQDFTTRVRDAAGARAASLCLIDAAARANHLSAGAGLPDDLHHCHCDESGVHVLQPKAALAAQRACLPDVTGHCVDVAVSFQQQRLGTFKLYFDDARAVGGLDVGWVEVLCLQLGVAIENLRLIARDRQFAVSEERNLMAQGLHDSIAQSLSFLNLQVQMLEGALAAGKIAEAGENLAFIKDGVQESYDDVRELLLNFRTRLSKQDFLASIHTLLRRFEQQTQVAVTLNVTGDGLPLSPQQQLQVVFILQEALSNVRKHAFAQHVLIEIEREGDFVLRITDDGVGFDKDALLAKRSQHVGTAIMQERAQMVRAQVVLRSIVQQGTVVELTLPSQERVAV